MKRPFISYFLILFGGVLLLTTALRAETSVSPVTFSDRSRPGTLKIDVAVGTLRIQGGGAAIAITADGQSAPASNFRLTEQNNVAVLEGGTPSGAALELSVPVNTTVVITNHFTGSIHVRDLSGDVEIKNQNGEIHLDNLSGGALVETMNGRINASFLELPSDKPLSFASMNGEVRVQVPVNARANVRLRTQNGSIRNEFEGKSFVAQAGPGTIAPTSAIPPMTGGRLAAGTINGGGTEISIATVNGHVTLQASGAPRPDRRISIQFENAEKYTDVRYHLGMNEGRDVVLEEIHDYLTQQAEALLPAGYGLGVKFTDIDLAGDYFSGEIRKVTELHPPALKFSYIFTNPAGDIVKQGDARLRDTHFQLLNPLHNHRIFYHEEAMLDQWLRKTIGALDKS